MIDGAPPAPSRPGGAPAVDRFTRGALVDRISAVSRRPAGMGGAPGDGVISLAMGEPSEGTPGPVVDAAIAALHRGRTRYSALTGLPALRRAIAEHVSGRHRRSVDPAQVVCTHGASAGLAAAVLAVVDPGDRVVIPEPTYSLYADHVAMAAGTVSWVANHPDGTIDVDRVVAELEGARLLVLCSPGNPTGAVIGPEQLERLADAALHAGAFVLCDEAYGDIVFDGRPCPSVLDLDEADHLICARTFSKAYAMTGWRLGYVVAAAPIADAGAHALGERVRTVRRGRVPALVRGVDRRPDRGSRAGHARAGDAHVISPGGAALPRRAPWPRCDEATGARGGSARPARRQARSSAG